MASKILSLLVAGGVLAGIAAARAEPLAVEACRQHEVERQRLEAAGLRADLAKGATWGKANLAADRLAQIRLLIETDEALLFRCAGQKPLVTLREDPPEEPQPDQESQPAAKPAAKAPVKAVARKPAAAAAVPPAEPGKAVAPPRRKASAAAAPPAPAAEVKESAVEAAPPKPRPRARPKSDDAYRASGATEPKSAPQ